MRARSIVVGVDGSRASTAALQWAANAAVARDCDLVAVRVYEPHVLAPYAPAAARLAAKREPAAAADALNAAVRDVATQVHGLRVQKVLAKGLTARILLRLAEDADMLVLGSHRPSDWTKPAVGAVALACLRHAACPVVLVAAPQYAQGGRPPGPRQPAGRILSQPAAAQTAEVVAARPVVTDP